MQLQDFISQSIQQIVNGIRQSQQENKTDARINPSGLKLGSSLKQQELYDFENQMLLSSVEFDVAVTAEETTGTKGGIGIFVGAVGVGSQGKTDTRSSSVSRIKFTVPIALPKGQ